MLPSRDAERLRLIRLVHIARRDLAMAEDDYRQALRTASKGRTDSSGKMTVLELEKAMTHFKRCGFKVKSTKKPGKMPDSDRKKAADPEAKKIRAIWLMLHELGAVQNPSEAALAAYVRRIGKVDDLHWLHGKKVERVIETLKKWALRHLPSAIEKRLVEVRSLPLDPADVGMLNERLNLAFTRGTYDPMQGAWEALGEILKAHRQDGQ